jgi:DNA-binding GntR family transcriptional regulator
MADADPWYLRHFSKEAAEATYTLRVTHDPILALRALAVIEDEVQKATEACVRDCRELGHSWNEIAEGLRVTKQAAHRRFHDLDPAGDVTQP